MKANAAILKWILLAGFMTGILFANLVGEEKLEQVGAFSFLQEQEWNRKEQKVTTDAATLIEKRAVVWMLFFVFGVSPAFFILFWGLTFWVGFSLGLLETVAAFADGLLGVWHVNTALFPQFLFYFLAFYLLYRKRAQQKKQTTDRFVHGGCTKTGLKKTGYAILETLILFLLVMLGILTENYK
ncbi:MAG: hypothetical protein ACI4HI_03515 [Lachnospiraceae bacterium]